MRTLSFGTLLALAVTVQAQDGFPIATDRPSYSDAASLVPLGRWQLETGSTYYRVGGSGFGTFPELLVRVPLSDRWEIRAVNLNYTEFEGGRGSGFQDPGVGFKYMLTGPSSKATVTIVGLLQIPAGTKSLRADRVQPTAKIAWYLPTGPADGLGGNLVVGDYSPVDVRFTQYAASLYWAHTFNPRLASFAEIYGLAPVAYGGDNGAFADAGFTYLLDKATQVDLRYGSGFAQDRDGWFIGAGISFRF